MVEASSITTETRKARLAGRASRILERIFEMRRRPRSPYSASKAKLPPLSAPSAQIIDLSMVRELRYWGHLLDIEFPAMVRARTARIRRLGEALERQAATGDLDELDFLDRKVLPALEAAARIAGHDGDGRRS